MLGAAPDISVAQPPTGRRGALFFFSAGAMVNESCPRLLGDIGGTNARPGLVNLYEAASTLTRQAPLPLSPADIMTRADGNTGRSCTAAIDLFCKFLGGVAGNLALTLGSRGGVCIGGGMAPRLQGWIERSAFRERFAAKGRFRAYLAAIPTFIIDTQSSPALIGAACALDMID